MDHSLYTRLFEDQFEEYDEKYLSTVLDKINILQADSKDFLHSLKDMQDNLSAENSLDLLMNEIFNYDSIFPTFTGIHFNIKYTEESELQEFVKQFELFMKTEAGSLVKVETISTNIKKILKTFRAYEAIINNINLLHKHNGEKAPTTLQLKDLFKRIRSLAERGTNSLTAMYTAVHTLDEFIKNHTSTTASFTNDLEKNYKGINIGLRVNHPSDMSKAKKVLVNLENFVDFLGTHNYNKYTKGFKKAIICAKDYYPMIIGDQANDSIVAFFHIKLKLIFLPYDHVDFARLDWIIYHEFAHYIWSVAALKLKGDLYRLWNKTYNDFRRIDKAFPTKYSYTNKFEAFSEMFAWYYYKKDRARVGAKNEVNPEVLKAFEKILVLLDVKLQKN